jgi:Ca-activated chloride channel family protein
MATGRNPRGSAPSAQRARGGAPHPMIGPYYRDVVRLASEALAVGLAASLVLALAVFAVSTQAQAAATAEAPGQGTLLFKGAPGTAPLAAPLLFTDVRIAVSGMAARATVTQRFANPTDAWQEGVYVFPLPAKAAVDHLEMRVGSRRIEGQIRERGEARATYEQAKKEGRKASLVEQERPNVFTTSVAHIGPGEEVVVAIEYQETLAYDAGSFRLRFPLVVAPRYVPGTIAVTGEPGTGWGANTDAVPDAERVTPPVAHPSSGFVNPVSIEVTLNAGFPLTAIDSPYHRIDVVEDPGHCYVVRLADGPVPADRDFELVWTPEVASTPGAAVFIERANGATYALAMLVPPLPADGGSLPASPREVVFIVDTSGSMEGTSIAQARQALLMALDRLKPGDRFNVIEFNSTARALYGAPVPADAATLAKAKGFVAGLRARGGTEMKPALEAALTRDSAPGFVRQVVFLTDGAVGNEGELIHLIRERLADRRLFTIGIGSAPNAFFLTKAAQFGRGTFTFIGDVREVGAKMGALFAKLESPVLTDVSVAWPGNAEAWPREPGDLYAGEPVVVVARIDAPDGFATISGRRAGVPWTVTLPLSAGADAPGIGVLWARAKIEALTDALKAGDSETETRKAIVEVALAHHLVSRYTSLVAVDVTPTVPPGVESTRAPLPTNLPAGWSYDAVFGGPQTATPSPLHFLLGLLLIVAGVIVRSSAGGKIRVWARRR